jgi:hypothetical protein
MVDRRPRLTLWSDGAYVLTSNGIDGGSTLLAVQPDGAVVGSTTTSAGIREVMYLEEGSQPTWVSVAATDLNTIANRTSLWRDGRWSVGTQISGDGLGRKVERWTSNDGSWWERGFVPRSNDGGDTTWVKIWHGAVRAPGGGTTRESFIYGNDDYKGHHGTHRTSFGQTTVVEKDAGGHTTRQTSVYGGYNHNDSSHERQVIIKYPDGSWVRQLHHTNKDGSWQDWTTTHDKNGHTVTRTATGRGTTTETYKEREDDDNSVDAQEPPDEPDPPDKDSPTGDGDAGGTEGNPDGPLAGVSIRDLLDDDWEGPEEVDTLGDLDAMMRPWLERIRAALASGAAGRSEPGELVDSLGAPPEIAVDLIGYEPDDLADHDSLGRPPPIFGSPLDLGSIVISGESALSVTELLTAVDSLTSAFATMAKVRHIRAIP